jgi:hypothetical protein
MLWVSHLSLNVALRVADIISLLSYFEKIEYAYEIMLLSVCMCVCLCIPPPPLSLLGNGYVFYAVTNSTTVHDPIPVQSSSHPYNFFHVTDFTILPSP